MRPIYSKYDLIWMWIGYSVLMAATIILVLGMHASPWSVALQTLFFVYGITMLAVQYRRNVRNVAREEMETEMFRRRMQEMYPNFPRSIRDEQ